MIKICFSLAFLVTTFIVFGQNDQSTMITDEQIEQLINQLSLEEKAALCSGRDDWSTSPIERLNIPWIWMADGPHGLRRAPATNKPGYGDQLPATCYPTASAMAATWDLNLVEQIGQHLGRECQALGVNVLLGPGVNIKRSVLGGRNFEYYSEDPILSGKMGAAFIKGVQSEGVGTSLKHYTANNVETMRMFMDSDVDTRTLHEIYLRPFEIAVREAQPWTIMACYNRVQGEYGTQNPYLLTKILMEEWGFKGVVISDWFAVVNRIKAIEAGMHIEMPHVSDINDKLIVEAVKNGSLDEKKVDQLVKQILSLVFKAKKLDRDEPEFDKKKHHDFARKVAAESATLLKNDRNLLPVNTSKYRKIALIGEFAQNPRFQGNGSSEVKPTMLDNALEVINKEYGEVYEFEYTRGYKLEDDNDFGLIGEAAEKAKSADLAIIFAGLPLHYESEGIDRKHIDLPEAHNKLIEEIALVQENTVVVLTNGSAVSMPWEDKVATILETWLGGQAGAGGVADVLFGEVNPSGKLAETFPVKLEDTPAYFNFPGEQGVVTYGERIFVGYRYYDEKEIEPLFPFGHGLSYTEFEYSSLQVSNTDFKEDAFPEVTVKLKNTGPVKGKEVIQLYISDPVSSIQRPKKELKHFAKIELQPGEEKEVRFQLTKRDFAHFDAKKHLWLAETGDFILSVGSSSRDIRLKQKVNYTATKEVPLRYDEYTFFSELWRNPESRKILKSYCPNWVKNNLPEDGNIDIPGFNFFMVDHPLIKYPYITGGELTKDDVYEIVEKCSELTFIP